MSTAPRHDHLIVELLSDEKLKVEVGHDEPSWNKKLGIWMESYTILIRHNPTGIHRLAPIHPNSSNYPRLRVCLDGRAGKKVWLLPHRVVWVAFNEPTHMEIDHIDQDPWNWNLWNLRPADRLLQMKNRFGNWRQEELEDPDLESGSPSLDEWPDPFRPPGTPF